MFYGTQAATTNEVTKEYLLFPLVRVTFLAFDKGYVCAKLHDHSLFIEFYNYNTLLLLNVSQYQ